MTQDAILATYLLETPHSVERAVEALAGEGSTGTFVAVPGETAEIKERFRTRLHSVRELPSTDQASFPQPPNLQSTKYERAEITVAVPMEMAGSDLSTLMASILGNIFELKELSGLRLLDFDVPADFVKRCLLPQFGIEGTRKLANVHGRPLIGTIIKPSVGLSPEQTADMVRELAEAGIDFIKDDELMTSPVYSPLAKRVEAIMRVINDHADKTGKRVMYAFNISGDDIDTMLRNHDLVLNAGGTCIMLSVNHVGFAGAMYVRRHSQLPIHGHRNGWGIFTRAPMLGMEFTAYQKLWRLAGIDHLHVNGIRNKFWEPDESVVRSVKACLTPLVSDADRLFPVLSSGQWGGQAPDTYRLTQTVDVMYLAGGGIQGHPGGAGAGVRAIQQAWEAAVSGVSLDDYAAEHIELRQSIAMFDKRGKA
ncbi:MAG: ribulose-bisphosphate carboxylase large subunit family protein [Burkholderiales bacterium]|nr:ribulose-bisphosphate carboxylase large subunit family protein [Anaerolineae bacterium]